MAMQSLRKRYRFLISVALCGVIIAGYYWLSHDSSTSIHPYDPSKDRAALVNMFKPNAFWLSDDADEQHATDTFEHALDYRASSTNPCDAGNLSIYVYRDEQATKGFVTYYPVSRTAAKILYIAVSDQYRRRGYAEKLMNFALQDLKRRGFHHVELVTRVTNQRAQGLYKKYGFKEGWNDGTLVSFERTL